MTYRRQFRLISPSVRASACRAIAEAPEGHLCEVKEPTRSAEQNAKLWPMLTDVAKQVKWPNMKGELVYLSQESWKHMFTQALDEELEMVPNLSGTGLVMLGKSTSVMSKRKFGELIEFIMAFGAGKNVVWSEKEESPMTSSIDIGQSRLGLTLR